jgi:hypothetical protein
MFLVEQFVAHLAEADQIVQVVKFVSLVFVGAVVGLEFQRAVAYPTSPAEAFLHQSAYFFPIRRSQVGSIRFFIHREILLSC